MNKLKATLDCIKASETINNGEYFVIHSDFIIALEEEINKLTEEPKKIEKLDHKDEAYVDSAIEGIFFRKINEIIDYINKGNKDE